MMFIPIINIFIMLYVCYIVNIEYDHECYKVINNNARVDSQVCKTKYPFVFVHGCGFRDLKYINYLTLPVIYPIDFIRLLQDYLIIIINFGEIEILIFTMQVDNFQPITVKSLMKK